MSPRPFFLRLLAPFAMITVLMAVVAGGIIYWVGRGTIRWDQVQALDLVAGTVRQSLAADGRTPTPTGVEELRNISHVWNARITLIDGNGVVTFDTHADAASMQNHNDRPEVIDARRQHVGSSSRDSATLGEHSLYLAELIDEAKPDGLVVRVSYPKQHWATLETPVWLVSAGGIVAAILMVTLLALILQRQWIKPTRELAGAAEMMAMGDWHARVRPQGADDVQFLADKMNLLASHAQNQLDEIGKQRRDLRGLVDTLPDPILVTDGNGRVLLINQPAAELLELTPSQVIGKKTVSVVSDEVLLQLIDAASPKKSDDADGSAAVSTTARVQREVRLMRGAQRLTYGAVATPTAVGGVLLLLRDVSAMANTVQMKTDFVANASHELRTPIAAIKIALETLRDVFGDDRNQSERCISIIDGHVKRLEEMLGDLLDLSRLESPDAEPKMADVKPWDLFAVVRSTMGPSARQKGVELRFDDATDTPASFHSDERLLHLVLKNLVENSVKFTPTGGSITVSVRPENGNGHAAVRLSVIDTGIGIPPEHRDRVFERFYQVDPARSGTAGRGTGLGLAIVKHAVAALGGTVKLESAVGKGTTVACVLPQDGSGTGDEV
jgi:two-component system phosphate regulon sensor histidine kinase PhoR